MTQPNQRELLLELLRADNNSPVTGSLRVMKSLFLTQQELSIETYDFVPWRLGPAAFEVHDRLDDFEDDDLIDVEDGKEDGEDIEIFSLTEKGKNVAQEETEDLGEEVENKVEEKKKQIEGMNFDDIITTVYEDYPSYTEESEVKWLV